MVTSARNHAVDQDSLFYSPGVSAQSSARR
jgi:hypothetical protein